LISNSSDVSTLDDVYWAFTWGLPTWFENSFRRLGSWAWA
jgi:hypothetical protein